MNNSANMRFSEWMIQATPDQKEALFQQVMEDVAREQEKITRKASNGQNSQACDSPEQKANGFVG